MKQSKAKHLGKPLIPYAAIDKNARNLTLKTFGQHFIVDYRIQQMIKIYQTKRIFRQMRKIKEIKPLWYGGKFKTRVIKIVMIMIIMMIMMMT